MKKLIALLLAAVLLLSALPFAGAGFNDSLIISEDYERAVNEMAETKVLNGFADGSFGPRKTLTRAQTAKIVCGMLEGADKVETLTKTETGFSDVPASHWAAKYVAYCVDKGIVSGVGGGKFNPDAKLSAAAFAKMLLIAYGNDASKYSGADWITGVKNDVKGAYINNKVSDFTERDLTRQEAAQMAWNAKFAYEAEKAAVTDMPSRPFPKSVPEKIKIYAIGNSFSNNCVLGYLYEVLKDVGVKDLTLANLYYSGCSLQTHLKFMNENADQYTYYKRTTGDWVVTKGVTFDEALMDEDWDIISFQSTPGNTYQPAKNRLMYYVQKHHPNANFIWNVIWAHSKRSKQSAFAKTWKGDQMAMWKGQVNNAIKWVEPDPRIRAIIPTGTAIQNARSSFIGDNLDRDTYHLNEGIGYYIASIMWCCKLTGVTPDQINYVPDGLLENPPHGFDKNMPGLKEALVKVARESAKNALANPYEVTQSQYTTMPQ